MYSFDFFFHFWSNQKNLISFIFAQRQFSNKVTEAGADFVDECPEGVVCRFSIANDDDDMISNISGTLQRAQVTQLVE